MGYNMKKMIFAGCSFTYGHGLWHYTKEEGLPKNDEVVHKFEFPKSIQFLDDNRFSRLVSNHFESDNIVKQTTAGCDEVSVQFVKELFGLNTEKVKWADIKLNYNDVSHLIFQTSFLDRCALYENGERMSIYDPSVKWKNHGKILEHLLTFWNDLKLFYYNEIRNLFEILEENNIKCYMLAMNEDYYDLIQDDEFIKKRFIEIEYDGKKFNDFETLLTYNEKLRIVNDTDYFEFPPKDLHPSLECQRIVADSIIKKLETDIS